MRKQIPTLITALIFLVVPSLALSLENNGRAHTRKLASTVKSMTLHFEDFKNLPTEVQLEMLKNLSVVDLENLKKFNPHFIPLANDIGVQRAAQENTLNLHPNTLKYFTDMGIHLVYLSGGTFRMGSPEKGPALKKDEYPHEVDLSPFFVTKAKITREQWHKMAGSDPDFPDHADPKEIKSWNGCPKCPVTYVSPSDIHNLVTHLAVKGIHAALPTEAQQEFYMRGKNPDGSISQTLYPWGDDPGPLGDWAWYKENSGGRLHPVATTTPHSENSWGLVDALGNAAEWSRSWYGPYPVENTTLKDPEGPMTGSSIVYRGSSWLDSDKESRPAKRSLSLSDSRMGWVGFRLLVR
jgi:sulfatase modifying factor 1